MKGGLPDERGVSAVVTKVLCPKSHLGPVSQLLRVARVAERHAKSCVGRGAVFLLLGSQEVFRIAFSDDPAQLADIAYAGSQALLQAVAEPLASLSRARKMDGYALFFDVFIVFRAGILVFLALREESVPSRDGKGKLHTRC